MRPYNEAAAGRAIKAHLVAADRLDAKIERQAKQRDDHRKAAGLLLIEAKKHVENFEAFLRDHVQIPHSSAYDCIAIAEGKDVRGATRKRVADHRARKGLSVTDDDVTDNDVSDPRLKALIADIKKLPQGQRNAEIEHRLGELWTEIIEPITGALTSLKVGRRITFDADGPLECIGFTPRELERPEVAAAIKGKGPLSPQCLCGQSLSVQSRTWYPINPHSDAPLAPDSGADAAELFCEQSEKAMKAGRDADRIRCHPAWGVRDLKDFARRAEAVAKLWSRIAEKCAFEAEAEAEADAKEDADA